MADVRIVDIKGNQWNFKDENARNRIETIEEKINKNFTYSTEEVDTGKKWINGKPIYRRVFIGDFGTIGTSFINLTSKINTINKTNIDMILNVWAKGIYQGNIYQYSSGFKYESRPDNNYYIQMLGADIQNVNTIILEFTKTTD